MSIERATTHGMEGSLRPHTTAASSPSEAKNGKDLAKLKDGCADVSSKNNSGPDELCFASTRTSKSDGGLERNRIEDEPNIGRDMARPESNSNDARISERSRFLKRKKSLQAEEKNSRSIVNEDAAEQLVPRGTMQQLKKKNRDIPSNSGLDKRKRKFDESIELTQVSTSLCFNRTDCGRTAKPSIYFGHANDYGY